MPHEGDTLFGSDSRVCRSLVNPDEGEADYNCHEQVADSQNEGSVFCFFFQAWMVSRFDMVLSFVS
jgi:hypothetical protein